jgi:hypothetical protein
VTQEEALQALDKLTAWVTARWAAATPEAEGVARSAT